MDFLTDLKTNVFCRLGVSQIHGIGVFAIRDIPKDANPFVEKEPFGFEEVSLDAMKHAGLDDAQQKLVLDMCPQEGEKFYCPAQGLNGIGIAWYLNHSKAPNMREDDGNFFALRDIKAGDELTADYQTYGKLNL